MKRDTREMLQLSGWLTLALFPVFGAMVVIAITIEAVLKWIF